MVEWKATGCCVACSGFLLLPAMERTGGEFSSVHDDVAILLRN